MPNTWLWVGRNVSGAISEWDSTFDEEGVVYRDRIRIGDRILWWKSGRGAGVYGHGRVIGQPRSAGLAGWHKREYRFKVKVDERFPEAPLLKNVLQAEPALQDLLSRVQQQRPNPREVRPDEWRALKRELAKPRFQTEVVRRFGAGFGEAASNRRVERAAVSFVTKRYMASGWTVKSVEAQRCGFDLLCIKAEDIRHIEVKGAANEGTSFILTAGELEAAKIDPLFNLAFVSSALLKPRMAEYSGSQLLRHFDVRPISHLCRLKRRTAG